MIIDTFARRHSSGNELAVRAFERAVAAVAAHRPDAAAQLDAALVHDPDLVSGHALRGLAGVSLGRAETMAAGRRSLVAARAAAARCRGGTADEAALLETLELAVEGHLARAADRLDHQLAGSPGDFLAIKLAHALRFMTGDAAGMLRTTASVLPSWSARMPGFGFLLGCHAFALEECGDYRGAERVGRQAVALEPYDAWGLHAVAHVLEMENRAGEGVAWLDASRPIWKTCNNFAFHMAWHLALLWLARGEHAVALDIYDREVRPEPTDDFRDHANAVSLLVRLEQEGIDTGSRWEELVAIATRRRQEITLVFASLHNLLALAKAGDLAAAGDLVAAMHARAGDGDDQAAVARKVGCALAGVISSNDRSMAPRADLAEIAGSLPAIGGSHAQRDVFVRELALVAAAGGDHRALRRLVALRRQRKADDRFNALAEACLRKAGPLRRPVLQPA